MFGIGYVTRQIEPCTKALFDNAVESKEVKSACDLIARLEQRLNETTDEKRRKWCETRISQAKRTLPCITPMAHFKGNRRSVANAIPSGLNMIDIDHIDNPRELWQTLLDGQKTDGWQIALVHVTPSTHGLRIIFRQPPGKTIEEAQAELARTLAVTYDAVTKDMARCSFLVPQDYILYRDDNLLFNPDEETTQTPSAPTSQTTSQKAADTAAADEPQSTADTAPVRKTYATEFKGIPYQDIIGGLLTHAGYDTTPTEGERNNATYMLARNLRYVCDFNADHIIGVLPDWGLNVTEVRNTVDSAVKSVRMVNMPSVLRGIIDRAMKMKERQESDLFKSVFDFSVDDGGFIGEFVKIQPPFMRNAAYVTAMACLGTLLTRLRGHGCDGSVIAPNFMVTVSAPQATGKSFMKRIYEQILAPVKQEDERQRKRMREIEKENRKNKDKEGYEEKEFDGAIRLLPSNTSNRILIERMDLAKGQHLMMMAEEIDSITKAEKSGKWSEKSDIYRLAYDNSEWGQDYASENSYHAVVPIYMNLLFSGTPAAVGRFFNDIENGLITRFLFVDLPDTYGQRRPPRTGMAEETKAWVDKKLMRLYQQMQNTGTEDGLIWLDTTKMVEDATNMYDEVQRRMYLGWQDDVCRDLARRRYADYVVKMMMIETWLNDGVYTDQIRDRVLGIMNLCTEQLIASYGDEINKSLTDSVEKYEKAVKQSRKQDILDLMPDMFTAKDFRDALVAEGGTYHTASSYITRLIKAGLIKMEGRGLYKKI